MDPARARSEPGTGDWAQPVTALYGSHYQPLVRHATTLVRDHATAEDVVQDVFITLEGSLERLRNPGSVLPYLRRCVTNRALSILRHRSVAEREAPPPVTIPSAEESALAALDRSLVVSALTALPPRQRQALMLRYYADLSEAQIADIMGISQGAVKSHTARARSVLREALQAAILRARLVLRGSADRDLRSPRQGQSPSRWTSCSSQRLPSGSLNSANDM